MTHARAVFALVLAATLALPAYTCDGYRAPDGSLVDAVPAGADSTEYVAAQVPHRPIEDFDAASLESWSTLSLYLWPLLVVAALLVRDHWRGSWPLLAVELVLPPVSAWIMLNAVILGDIAYGAAISLVSLTLLWIIGVVDFVILRRRGPAAAGV